MNIDRIKKAADAVKWHRRSDLLNSLLTAIDEELGPIGSCKSNHLISPDERQDPSPDVVTISRKEWDRLKLRSRRCFAWDQWAQEELTEIPDALRTLDPPPRQVVEAPELTDSELDSVYRECQSLGTHYHEIHRSRLRAVIALAFSRARLAPTPPKPASGPVVEGVQADEEEMYHAMARWIHRTASCPSPMEGFVAGWQDHPAPPQPSANVVDWQPLATAPKDRMVLVYEDGWVCSKSWDESIGQWIFEFPFHDKASHWMPMMSPPANGLEGRRDGAE